MTSLLRFRARLAALLLAALVLAGCHTIEGVGKDLQTVGETLQNVTD